MKCTKCNKEIENDSIFCCYCGASLKEKRSKLNTYALKCPNCDGKLEIEDGLDTFYCQYCGGKIVLEGQSDAAYHAKEKIKWMEHEEKMADKKFEHEKYKIEKKEKRDFSKEKQNLIISLMIPVVCIIIIAISLGSCKISSNKQEKQLQKLVNEIMIDIENEDFEAAYVKAQSIKYTEDWSQEIEDKWDDTRKEIIDQIIKAEKEATGSSSHKPEKEGWFSSWFD